jgi:hypothetical protein
VAARLQQSSDQLENDGVVVGHEQTGSGVQAFDPSPLSERPLIFPGLGRILFYFQVQCQVSCVSISLERGLDRVGRAGNMEPDGSVVIGYVARRNSWSERSARS